MKPLRSAEEWLAKLRSIIESYREQAKNDNADGELLLQTELAGMRELGLNSGDAMKYLKPHLTGH